MKSAKKLNLEEILHRAYPRFYRAAMALCQDRNTGLSVVRKVLAQSAIVFDRWESDEEADRWFWRYVVMCSRGQPTGTTDPLLSLAMDGDSKGIIRAIRHLPMQQGEAYLLHHGEGLYLRHLATAMDCSSSAAANHLSAAEKELRLIIGDRLTEFAIALPTLMAGLVPPPGGLEVEVNQVIRRRQRRIRLQRWVVWPVKAGLTAVLAWVVWKVAQRAVE